MELPQKSKLPTKKEVKKIHNDNSGWGIFGFFFLISFPPALILTIIFWFKKFNSEKKSEWENQIW